MKSKVTFQYQNVYEILQTQTCKIENLMHTFFCSHKKHHFLLLFSSVNFEQYSGNNPYALERITKIPSL